MTAMIFNDVYCPGWAPVRCHPATGTPQWGSAEVHFFLIAFLLSFLFFLLLVFVFAALPNLSCMPTVPAQTRTSSYEEVNSLEISNSRFRPLTLFILAHVMSDVACDIEASERQRARAH